MQNGNVSGRKHYRLVTEDSAAARVVEFDSDGPYGVLVAADRLGTRGNVAIFEDDRPLARIRTVNGGGAWVINPPLLAPPPA